MTNKILKLPDVIKKTGLSRSTIYALMAEGTFPQSLKLGDRAVGWIEAEIDNWIKNKALLRAAV